MGFWIVTALLVGLAIAAWVRTLQLKRKCCQLNAALEAVAQAQAQQYVSTQEYRYILEQARLLFFVLDEEGNIIETNPRTCKVLLYKEADLVGTGIFDIDTQFSKQTWRTFWQHLRKHGEYPLETDFIRKDGAPVRVENRYHYVHVEGKAFCFCLADDISTLKLAKDQLLLANEKIEHLNHKLHKKIEQTGKLTVKAQTTRALKNELMDTVGFDMKTSLKSIMNMLDYLFKTAFGDTQQVFSQNAQSTAHALLTTIENILDSTRAESDDLILDRTPFRCQQIVNRAFHQLRPLAKDKRVRIHAIIDPSVPDYLTGDAQRIERILFNLIVNALLNNNTGDIFVRIKRLRDESSNALLEFTVKDHDEPDSHVIEKCYTTPLTPIDRTLLKNSHEYKLRLSVSRILIAMMGGKIWSHERPGRSALFFFTLRLETTNHEVASDNLDIDDSKALNCELDDEDHLRILVADDSFVNQQIIKLTIRALGHHFTSVRTGELTIKHLNEHDVDILLIDLTTRKGLETLKKALNLTLPKQVYTIGMTDLQHADIQDCIAKLNINDIITKPINASDLNLALKCALAEKKNTGVPANDPKTAKVPCDRMQSDASTQYANAEINRFAVQPAHNDVQPLSSDEISALIHLTGKRSPESRHDNPPHEVAENAIVQLKRNFIKTTPEMIAQLEQATTQSDHDLIKSIALAIKASTAYFDANEIETVINKMILLSEHRNYSVIIKIIDELKEAFIIVLERMQEDG